MAYKGSAVILVPTDSKQYCVKVDGHVSFVNRYMKVTPYDIGRRIIASLGPPCNKKFRIENIDLVGPLLAVLILIAILHYGYRIKEPSATDLTMAPVTSVLLYIVVNPCLGFVLCKLARASMVFWDLVGLLGYALYSHLITLILSLMIYQEESNAFFFLCLLSFGGLSALRICILLITSIPKPAARLLVCSTLFINHLLFLIFLHFTYMHPTFIYGRGSDKRVPTKIHTNL
ncbi:protein YIPF3-like [Neodiprion pinetum]|uniref:protein YIPF3-like n=1 Tax=Neodiprion pinetum TaxID=441929 RepID=UPI001EDD49E8|nr:protein YIPF3-like [Neodiprion pinetum]